MASSSDSIEVLRRTYFKVKATWVRAQDDQCKDLTDASATIEWFFARSEIRILLRAAAVYIQQGTDVDKLAALRATCSRVEAALGQRAETLESDDVVVEWLFSLADIRALLVTLASKIQATSPALVKKLACKTRVARQADSQSLLADKAARTLAMLQGKDESRAAAPECKPMQTAKRKLSADGLDDGIPERKQVDAVKACDVIVEPSPVIARVDSSAPKALGQLEKAKMDRFSLPMARATELSEAIGELRKTGVASLEMIAKTSGMRASITDAKISAKGGC